MSLFSTRFPNNEFAPFFRLLNEELAEPRRGAVRSFQPKFDVRELKDSFELHGELPGIEQKDINIEFTDPNTILVTGRTVRESSHGSPEAIEGEEAAKRIEDHTDKPDSDSYHKPTVEDESAEGQSAVTTQQNGSNGNQVGHHHKHEPKYKYWVSERSVGEFHRSFNFPGQVDQDAVKASLKNGILSIIVPKMQPKAARKIQVE